MRVLLCILLSLLPSSAYAGRTLYGWLPATTTVQSGGFELGTSVYERLDVGLYHERSTALSWTPAIGLTDSLELALPVVLVTRTQDDAAPWSGIAKYGAELRWLFLDPWPELRPLARLALARDVLIQTNIQSELGLALSYEYDLLQVEAATDMIINVNFSHLHHELRPGVGASVRVYDQLRVGAEFHGEFSGDKTTPNWSAFGPNLSWSHGRFWLVVTLGIGVRNIAAAPRLNIAMAW
jgi:hypothetical protein